MNLSPRTMKIIYHVNIGMFVLIFWLIMAGAIFGDDAPGAAPSAMPDQAKYLISHESDQEAILQAKLAGDIQRLHKDLIGKLKVQEDAAIRHADLDGAQAIKAEIASLQPKADVSADVAPADPVIHGEYRCTHSNDAVHGMMFRDDGTGETSLGDKFAWTLEKGMLTLTFTDGTSSKGEYHPLATILTSTGKTASGDDRANYYLER